LAETISRPDIIISPLGAVRNTQIVVLLRGGTNISDVPYGVPKRTTATRQALDLPHDVVSLRIIADLVHSVIEEALAFEMARGMLG
jgi:hypothetical protein